MKTITAHQEIVKHWIEKSPKGLTIPPNCFTHMDGKLISWRPDDQILVAQYPTKEAFYNPRNYMQGGFILAALDNTLGPLSYLSGAPSVSVQLNTRYSRPVAAEYAYIEVTAKITEQTDKKVFSEAEARSPEGELLTSVQATSHIIKD